MIIPSDKQDAEILREIYSSLNMELQQATRDVSDLQQKLDARKRHVKQLTHILDNISDAVCKRCKGQQQSWVFYDQDSSKLEPCDLCHGTGLSPLFASTS